MMDERVIAVNSFDLWAVGTEIRPLSQLHWELRTFGSAGAGNGASQPLQTFGSAGAGKNASQPLQTFGSAGAGKNASRGLQTVRSARTLCKPPIFQVVFQTLQFGAGRCILF